MQIKLEETKGISDIRPTLVVVVVLSDPFRGMGAWSNSTETQQSGHTPRSGPTFRRLNVVVRSPPLYRQVGRNGETTIPRGPTIQSPPIVRPTFVSLPCT